MAREGKSCSGRFWIQPPAGSAWQPAGTRAKACSSEHPLSARSRWRAGRLEPWRGHSPCLARPRDAPSIPRAKSEAAPGAPRGGALPGVSATDQLCMEFRSRATSSGAASDDQGLPCRRVDGRQAPARCNGCFRKRAHGAKEGRSLREEPGSYSKRLLRERQLVSAPYYTR